MIQKPYRAILFLFLSVFFLCGIFSAPVHAQTIENGPWNCTFTSGPILYTPGQPTASVTITGTCFMPMQQNTNTVAAPQIFTQTVPMPTPTMIAPGVYPSTVSTIPVPPQTTTPTITTNTTLATAGQQITMTWNGIARPTNTDWIGLFLQSNLTENKQWVFTNVNGTCNQNQGNASTSGSCTLSIPRDLPTGVYQLRLFSNGKASPALAVSAPLTINAIVQQPAPVQSTITTPVAPTANVAPVIQSNQLSQGTQGANYSSQITIYDQNPNDSLTVSITTTELPRGMTFARTNEYVQNNIRYITYTLSGTPQNAARFNPEITVRDAQGASVTKRFPLLINGSSVITTITKTNTKKKVTVTTTKKNKKANAINTK